MNTVDCVELFARKLFTDEHSAGETISVARVYDSYAIIHGRIKTVNRLASILVADMGNSYRFSVQVPGGGSGYNTEILKKYVNIDVVSDYADDAVERLIRDNSK